MLCAVAGEEKYNYPWYKLWVLTIIAGCYVGESKRELCRAQPFNLRAVLCMRNVGAA